MRLNLIIVALTLLGGSATGWAKKTATETTAPLKVKEDTNPDIEYVKRVNEEAKKAFSEHQYEKAIGHYLDALDVLRNLHPDEKSAISHIAYDVAICYSHLGRDTETMKRELLHLELALQADDQTEEASDIRKRIAGLRNTLEARQAREGIPEKVGDDILSPRFPETQTPPAATSWGATYRKQLVFGGIGLALTIAGSALLIATVVDISDLEAQHQQNPKHDDREAAQLLLNREIASWVVGGIGVAGLLGSIIWGVVQHKLSSASNPPPLSGWIHPSANGVSAGVRLNF